jgi:mediator of RNA polymerase II transcription subunit 18
VFYLKLAINTCRFIREIIQEGYRFVHGNVVLDLTRYLQIPFDLQERENKIQPKISSQLPTFESLTPFDSENKWVLMARVEVMNGNDPEQMQIGIDELVAVKTEFDGCFDFQLIDRQTLDTRAKG